MNATSGRVVAEPADQVERNVDGDDLVAQPLEGVLDASAGAQRYLALERAPALEHRDAGHRPVERLSRSAADGMWSTSAPDPCSARCWSRPPWPGPVLARQGPVQLHLLRYHLADPPDSLADRLLVAAGEVQPHRVAPAAVEERRLPGYERDVVAQRAGQQVGGVDEVRQRGPDEQAAGGPRPLGLTREVVRQGVEHGVAARPVDGGERIDVVAPAAPLEIGLHHQLRERRGAEVGSLLAEVDLLEHGRRRDHPAEPDARREDLREGAEVHHVDAAVERVEGRGRVALVAQQAVGVVLEHEQLALVCHLHQPSPARQGHRHARRVLEARHGVDELRAASLALEPVECLLEQVHAHAVGVHVHLHHLGLIGREHRHGARIGRALGDHDVAGIDRASWLRGRSPAGRRS